RKKAQDRIEAVGLHLAIDRAARRAFDRVHRTSKRERAHVGSDERVWWESTTAFGGLAAARGLEAAASVLEKPRGKIDPDADDAVLAERLEMAAVPATEVENAILARQLESVDDERDFAARFLPIATRVEKGVVRGEVPPEPFRGGDGRSHDAGILPASRQGVRTGRERSRRLKRSWTISKPSVSHGER